MHTTSHTLIHSEYIKRFCRKQIRGSINIAFPSSKIHHHTASTTSHRLILILTQLFLMVHDSLIICKSSETVEKERDGSNRQLSISSEKLWYPKLPFVRGHLLQGIWVVLRQS